MSEEQTKRSSLSNATFLLTGAHGFIGAWIVKRLLSSDARVVIFDQSPDPRRLRLIMNDDEIARATVITGDITEPEALSPIIEKFEVTHIVHLAGLQVPICRANPRLGAMSLARSMYSKRPAAPRTPLKESSMPAQPPSSE